MHFIINKSLHILMLSLLLLAQPQAAQEFLINDIRVEGLERITPGIVFNYLPMKILSNLGLLKEECLFSQH